MKTSIYLALSMLNRMDSHILFILECNSTDQSKFEDAFKQAYENISQFLPDTNKVNIIKNIESSHSDISINSSILFGMNVIEEDILIEDLERIMMTNWSNQSPSVVFLVNSIEQHI